MSMSEGDDAAETTDAAVETENAAPAKLNGKLTDYGAFDKAKREHIVEVEERVQRHAKNNKWQSRWRCNGEGCTKDWIIATDPAGDFKKHVQCSHDEERKWLYDDDPEYCSLAMYLYPNTTKPKRAEKVKVKEEAKETAKVKAAAAKKERAAARGAANTSPPTLEAAVDALLAAGFTASGEELAWLAREVKSRLGHALEPPPKKPRTLSRELASLKAAEEQQLPEARGNTAARMHARRR